MLPDYHGNSLNNLIPSLLARLDGGTPAIKVPSAARYVVVLVDGLGSEQLDRFADHTEHLVAMRRQRLTCGVPSTTATSLTSLGCGVTPGLHGVTGYTFYEEGCDAVVNALTWEGGPEDIESFRQVPTQFRRMRAGGRSGATVTLGRFDGSALTQLAFSGAESYPREDEDEVERTVDLVSESLERHEIVYCYERLLDHRGHGYGVGSWQWLDQLGAVDDLVSGLVSLASEDVCVLVTGDHGMVNVPADHRLTIEEVPALDGFHHVGGEGRFRQLYTDDPRRLAWAWRSVLGERAEVLVKDEAIEAGWFGEVVTDPTRARIGDVVVAMNADWALMSTTFPGEFGLVGMHGSLTPEEMYVPLLQAGGRE